MRSPYLNIPESEFSMTFSRSSGAGGQNINKVNTKATLEWKIHLTKAISTSVIERFCKKYPQFILSDGTVVITSQRSRSQGQNIDDCIEKLYAMIEAVFKAPKQRRPTKPKRSSIERRLKSKRLNSEKKKMRQDDY